MTIVTSGPQLASALDAIRLSLHVFAAAVFVGGQFAVAGMLPAVRRLGEGASKAIARAFARVLWPAYAVLLLTGIWNVSANRTGASSTWDTVLGIKIGVALLAGLAALIHSRAQSRALVGACGATAGLASLAALVLGVVLAG